MKIILSFITFTLLVIVSSATKTYEGHKVYRITPKDEVAVTHLEELRRSGVGEFWDDYFAVNQDARINVAPNKTVEFLKFLNLYDIESEEVIANLQSVIDNQRRPSLARSSERFLSLTWNEYHNLESIYAWLDELEEQYPGIVKTEIKGLSVNEVPIKGIVINYHPERVNKAIGMLEGTLHAREWICTATVTWIIKEFLTSTDPAVRALAERLEWHIFPVVNPDGYNYTFIQHRMWRKNRSPTNFTICAGASNDMSHGVDLNRNFDFHWNTAGVSPDPCSNLFPGPSPFSEPEARAIRDYVLKINQEGDLIYYIGFHSFGQLIIVPFSHVSPEGSLDSINYSDMFEISARAADALKQRYGTEYRVGLSASVMYPMSGSSFDWVKNATNVPVSLLLELRDRGTYGFLLPPEQIIPTAEETMDALLEMDKTTRSLGYIRSSGAGVYASYAVIVTISVFVRMFG